MKLVTSLLMQKYFQYETFDVKWLQFISSKLMYKKSVLVDIFADAITHESLSLKMSLLQLLVNSLFSNCSLESKYIE